MRGWNMFVCFFTKMKITGNGHYSVVSSELFVSDQLEISSSCA